MIATNQTVYFTKILGLSRLKIKYFTPDYPNYWEKQLVGF